MPGVVRIVWGARINWRFVPLPCLLFLWFDYLSLTIAGQLFYQYQWDILLLEAGIHEHSCRAAGSAFGKVRKSSTGRAS